MWVMVAMEWRAQFRMRRLDSMVGKGLTFLKYQEDPLLPLSRDFWRSAVAGCFALCNA